MKTNLVKKSSKLVIAKELPFVVVCTINVCQSLLFRAFKYLLAFTLSIEALSVIKDYAFV